MEQFTPQEFEIYDMHAHIFPHKISEKATESIGKFDWSEVASGELMSHDGVIFTGFDLIKEKERSIICYFKYYR